MSHSHNVTHEGESHGSYGSYITGFILAVILTVAAFAVVVTKAFDFWTTLVVVSALAVVQIVVHVVFFLHMNTSSKQRWNLMTFILTVLSVLIIVAGTLFVMWNTQMHMMSR
ncbi:cytochrome o ubiquinol oxidase subunit IV [Aristophania vespae]|uniref:Cytochrome bo(3) ubiquinol oxidase subunit 4 n=1 Tax=Aristophania vespae TaxID=2697033 RepID=A0A6P1NKL1_9PROT|nr:cytochrome o ubiquinol oxidase subunit IV [Aristophania vespae]QHI95401.1 cytochrome o ubiquinol oxidase subunit IV [Aristophania vespae]UMM64683.1 Cytochrome bo(3) ubiquinol oxidase subunit 4 [Aristophania vespae]